MRTVEHSPEQETETGSDRPSSRAGDEAEAQGSGGEESELGGDDAPAEVESTQTKPTSGKVVVTDDEIRAQLEVIMNSCISYLKMPYRHMYLLIPLGCRG